MTKLKIRTSARKSSNAAAENVGTKSAPFITEVIKSLPDSANSQVIQAAACDIYGQCFSHVIKQYVNLANLTSKYKNKKNEIENILISRI